MNTKPLLYITAIAKERSQSRAALLLNVSQSALSQQIKKVEAELGMPLFYKEKNELFLTDAGKIYVNGAQAALSIYQNALADIQKVRTRKRKEITFVYNHGLLKNISMVLSEYRQSHPDVYVNTLYGIASAAKDYLVNGMADFAVTATKDLANSMLGYIPLHGEELMLALPFGHPLVRRFQTGGTDFSLLQDEPFILLQNHSFIRQLSDRIFQQNQFIPRMISEVSEISAAIDMMSNGEGISFVPKSQTPKGRYIPFALNPAAEYHIVIAYQKSRSFSPAVQDLIMMLLKNYDMYEGRVK